MPRIKSKRSFLIPDNLPDDLFPPDDPRWLVAYVLLDLIIRKCIQNKIAERYEGMRFVALKHDYLRNVLPYRCRYLIKPVYRKLRGKKIIQTLEPEQTEKGRKCRKYALCPEYAGIPQRVQSADAVHRQKQLPDDELPTKNHERITGFMTNLSFDVPRLMECRERLRSPVDCMTDDDYRWQQMFPVRAMDAGVYAPSVNRYGRFHSSVTGLNKKFRKRMLLDNEPITWLDVSDCQPLLLFAYARDWSRMRPCDRNKFIRREFPENPKDHYRFRKDMRKGACTAADVEDGIAVCESDKWKQFTMGHLKVNKEEAKILFIRFLFAKMSTVYRDEQLNVLWKAFKKRFPTTASMILAVKTGKGTDHRRLAWILQNAEATIVIDGVCKHIMKNRPHIPIVTIHDGIGSKACDADYVRSVMTEQFAMRGINPTIKVGG